MTNVSKNISPDKEYIDYTRGNSGWRVWEDMCREIIRKGSESKWSGVGKVYRVPHQFQDLTDRTVLTLQPADFGLAPKIRGMGSDELNGLIDGTISFAEALAKGGV